MKKHESQGKRVANSAGRVQNLGALFDASSMQNQVALNDVDGHGVARNFSYAEMVERIGAVAQNLLSLGHQRGDRIGIIGLNTAEYLWTYFGIMQAGLVAVPINHRLPAEAVAFVVEDSALRLVFADKENADILPKSLPVISLEEQGELELSGGNAFEPLDMNDDEDAMVLYTSGSTGRPSGVPLTHRGQLWVLKIRSANASYAGHSMLVAAPLSHMNALLMSKLALFNGATVTLLSQFTEQGYLSAIETFGCTWLTSVPAMLARVVARTDILEKTDLSSVSVVAMGSAAPGHHLFSRLKALFPSAMVVVNYGSTEAGAGIFGGHPKGSERPDMSLGYPLTGTGFRLIDSSGNSANEGELQVSSPAVMSHYLNRPEKTKNAFTDDGYYLTGDIMRRDENGFVFFISRVDDIFKCNGETIIPVEIERLVEKRDDVQTAIVVPVADELRGQVPVAFIVPAEGKTAPDQEDITSYVLARAPAYMHPRQVIVIDVLPLGPTGKIDKRVLIAMAKSS